MNTKRWIVISTIAWGWALAGPPLQGADLSTPLLVYANAITADDDAPTRQDVLDGLRAARTAMEKGNLDAADRAITWAEQSGVSLGMLHLGDTPKKARRDLERLRARQEADPRERAKTSVAQEKMGQPATSARVAAPAAGGEPNEAEGLITAPPAEGEIQSPAGAPREPALLDTGADASVTLLEARRALASGDVRQAKSLVEQAKRAPAGAETHDAPQQVEALIQKQQAISEALAQGDHATASEAAAQLAVEQAEGMLRYGELDAAESLARQAISLSGGAGGGDGRPQALLNRIQNARTGQGGAAAESMAAGEGMSPAQRRIQDLMDQSRAAIRGDKLHLAEQFARRAMAESAKSGEQAADGASPQELLAEILERRQPARDRGGNRLAGGASAALQQPAGVSTADYQEPAALSASQQAAQAAHASFDFPQEEPGDEPFDQPLSARPAAAPRATNMPAPRATAAAAAQPRAAQAQPVAQALASQWLAQGETALRQQDVNTARAYFLKARQSQQELSPQEQARLAQYLASADGANPAAAAPESPETLDQQPQPIDAPPAQPMPAGAPARPQPSTPASPMAPSAQPRPLSPQTLPPAATAPTGEPHPLSPSGAPGSLLEDVSAGQRMLQKRISVEVGNQQSRAMGLKETDPKGALELLKQTHTLIETAQVAPEHRRQLHARVERTESDIQAYFEAHRADIELEEKNQATLGELDRERQMKVEVDEKLAAWVNEYNNLMDEERYAEAEVVAKKAIELAPDNVLAEQLRWNANFVRRFNQQKQIQLDKENGFVASLEAVDASSVPFDDRKPIDFGSKLEWEKLTDRRKRLALGDRPRRNEREMQIEQKLKTPVSLQFQDAALSEVLDSLANVAGINIHIDPQGLGAEGVETTTPVTINLKQDISLKSALNLVLEPLHLGYVIKDEVLKITSEQYRNGELLPVMYPVADLVIPIPNFVPGPRMGLAGSLHDAYTSLGYGGGTGFSGQSPLAVVASRDGTPNSAAINPTLLGQMGASGGQSTMAGAMLGSSAPAGAGPGGAGGGVAADFDSLIQLITTTIAPTTWDEVGGSGAIEEFRTNLSLVISQTEDVHDQIRDLLEQLRRLQDLQVTIEVRFITLNDNFFERIGVDFDFNINDNTDKPFQIFGRPNPDTPTAYGAPPAGTLFTNVPRAFNSVDLRKNQTTVVGMTAPGTFSADLDIPFTQNSFGLSVPQFGGFDPTAGASLGFAILSDIEAFFFINAAQGDRRSNVLQAPKVTLFNGQQATVSDTSQSPFVISVIPVVGDFAAAQQPVIVVLNEGTFMTVQATVSSDRRFVRLTIVPFFSNIGEVDTFTFEGSTTTRESSGSDGPEDDTDAREEESETVTSGTTVQLPTFSFVTVTTTVSVPDGGTILLGGIKRLSEGRNEFGVPILSKVPYINRLFKNVGIGRETQSLMMMVTPRIIIQEEEEALLGISPTP